MIDVHCHLTDLRIENEIEKTIDEAKSAGVEMIINGTSIETSKRNVEIALKNEGVWAAVGVHPEETKSLSTSTSLRKELLKLILNPKVVAIGEIGLDYREGITEEEKVRQKELFLLQLEMAAEKGLPVIVHNRNADGDIIQVLSAHSSVLKIGVMLHCFTGSAEFMNEMAQLGCFFSFGGMITYKKNENIREVARQVPEDRLLLETDAPYLPPEPLRGTINTPANVKIVARRMAEIRGVGIEELDRLTSANARRLFSGLK